MQFSFRHLIYQLFSKVPYRVRETQFRGSIEGRATQCALECRLGQISQITAIEKCLIVHILNSNSFCNREMTPVFGLDWERISPRTAELKILSTGSLHNGLMTLEQTYKTCTTTVTFETKRISAVCTCFVLSYYRFLINGQDTGNGNVEFSRQGLNSKYLDTLGYNRAYTCK